MFVSLFYVLIITFGLWGAIDLWDAVRRYQWFHKAETQKDNPKWHDIDWRTLEEVRSKLDEVKNSFYDTTPVLLFWFSMSLVVASVILISGGVTPNWLVIVSALTMVTSGVTSGILATVESLSAKTAINSWRDVLSEAIRDNKPVYLQHKQLQDIGYGDPIQVLVKHACEMTAAMRRYSIANSIANKHPGIFLGLVEQHGEVVAHVVYLANVTNPVATISSDWDKTITEKHIPVGYVAPADKDMLYETIKEENVVQTALETPFNERPLVEQKRQAFYEVKHEEPDDLLDRELLQRHTNIVSHNSDSDFTSNSSLKDRTAGRD